MNFVEIGEGERPAVLFAHGWARNHRDFIPAAEALGAYAKSVLVDFPGFGESPRPQASWNTADYADATAAFLKERVGAPVVWVGHSFGGRVGLRMAVRHPELLRGLVLVSAAGIPARRSAWRRLKGSFRQARFRALRAAARDQAAVALLESRFGSPDYVQSRSLGLRDIFMNTIREDQSPDLRRITTPTVVLTGAKDTETPPEMGRRMSALIPGSEFLELPEFDHLSVLWRGHHIIALRAKEMLKGSRP